MILAGGHHSKPDNMPYFSEDNKYFIKHTKQNEIDSVISLQSEQIRTFIPKYIKSENNTLYLENILYGYRNPCVCDIKLGRQTYGFLSDENTIKKKEHRDIISTSRQFGCRLTGYVITINNEITKMEMSQQERHTLPVNKFKECLNRFIKVSKINIHTLIALIQDMIAQIKLTQYTFYGSSILIYTDYERQDKLGVKLVDFSYTYKNSLHETLKAQKFDNDVVDGLENIISFISNNSTG